MKEIKNDPRIPWVGLNMVQGMEAATVAKLSEHFGGTDRAWLASDSALEQCPCITPAVRQNMITMRRENPGAAAAELARAAKDGVFVMTPACDEYPALLMEIYGPPPAIYIKGKKSAEDEAAVAIVGTRKCTNYGRDIASELAHDLAKAGVTVVSGLAHGIDTAAHQGALKAGGRTIAVLGTGIDVVYPAINAGLARDIADTGALFSEFPFGTTPERWNFPRRNRLMSGLCKGVVVVEAPEQSGALITAAFALEQGREVFGVPGNVKSRITKGPHALIKDGARLVESAADILDELRIEPVQPELEFEPDLQGMEKMFYEAISAEPVSFDDLCRASGSGAAEAGAALTMLEMKRLVRQLPGRMFVRQS